MLEKLTSLNGVSGCEDEVRNFIINEIKDFCDSVEVDKIGNIIAFKRGKSSAKKMFLAAHMDEVGFIVKNITDDGYIKFAEVGGIDGRVLLGKRVVVGNKKLPGVIGIKAVHMVTGEERKKAVDKKDMYIDIGMNDRENAEKAVSKGDYITFDSEYIEFGNGRIKAKALDDRAGCGIIINLIKNAKFAFDTWCCFTVQEEVGLRGADVAARKLKPDIALIVEGTVCADTYDSPKHKHVSTMGGGGVISVLERTSRSDWDFVQYIAKLAEENNIPYQYKRTGSGGNDAGAVQTAGAGVKTAVISIPCRYIHSAVSVLDKKDFENAYKLITKVVENIGGNLWNY